MYVKNLEYGGFTIPPDIVEALAVIHDDIRITREDMRFRRSVERDKNVGPCGLKPGEYDLVTIQAYLNKVDEQAIRLGDRPEDITRGAFNVYMGLRLEEHLIRSGVIVDPESLAFLNSGGYRSEDTIYAIRRREFRKEMKAIRKKLSEILKS
ncbi:hypothetical protein [Dawidia soli]|uniref:Uncharacterized protein n=1 Tax=Dawidia soli TaxID=2782352 RepID=A0AAP2DJA4_9BACT|nr:hypothetical protein [Dawidia soli]MBT1690492.1 hypothetical protein [Dawidia soli]